MNVCKQSVLAIFCLGNSLQAQDSPTAQAIDSAKIVAVSPGLGVEVHDGDAVLFEVTIHYSLRSLDHAILVVYAERYADGPSLCDHAGVHHTEGGALARIKRGDGVLTLRFAWKEDSGPHAIVRRGAGSLAFGINLWTDKDERAVKPMIRALGTAFCRPIRPSGVD